MNNAQQAYSVFLLCINSSNVFFLRFIIQERNRVQFTQVASILLFEISIKIRITCLMAQSVVRGSGFKPQCRYNVRPIIARVDQICKISRITGVSSHVHRTHLAQQIKNQNSYPRIYQLNWDTRKTDQEAGCFLKCPRTLYP